MQTLLIEVPVVLNIGPYYDVAEQSCCCQLSRRQSCGNLVTCQVTHQFIFNLGPEVLGSFMLYSLLKFFLFYISIACHISMVIQKISENLSFSRNAMFGDGSLLCYCRLCNIRSLCVLSAP